MIRVTLNANGIRKEVIADSVKTVQSFMDEHNLNPSVTPVYLDGSPVTNAQASKTFKELGISGSAIVSSIVKTNNA